MPPRPPFPYQRSMGGRMMQGMPPQQHFRGPAMGQRMNTGRNSGGLLSKLIGGRNSNVGNATSNAANTVSRSAASGGGGILKAISNPASINGFLANSQKFLNTASQLGPMINQYGPMVRNIPAMWKLYKGLKNSTPENEVQETTYSKEPMNNKNNIPSTNQEEIVYNTEEETTFSHVDQGSSKPRLYI